MKQCLEDKNNFFYKIYLSNYNFDYNNLYILSFMIINYGFKFKEVFWKR